MKSYLFNIFTSIVVAVIGNIFPLILIPLGVLHGFFLKSAYTKDGVFGKNGKISIAINAITILVISIFMQSYLLYKLPEDMSPTRYISGEFYVISNAISILLFFLPAKLVGALLGAKYQNKIDSSLIKNQ